MAPRVCGGEGTQTPQWEEDGPFKARSSADWGARAGDERDPCRTPDTRPEKGELASWARQTFARPRAPPGWRDACTPHRRDLRLRLREARRQLNHRDTKAKRCSTWGKRVSKAETRASGAHVDALGTPRAPGGSASGPRGRHLAPAGAAGRGDDGAETRGGHGTGGLHGETGSRARAPEKRRRGPRTPRAFTAAARWRRLHVSTGGGDEISLPRRARRRRTPRRGRPSETRGSAGNAARGRPRATRHRGGADQRPGAASRGSRARGEGRPEGPGCRGVRGAARAAGFPSGSVERPTSQADGCAAPSAPNAAARAVRGGPGGTRLAPRAVISERKKLRMQQKDVFKTVYWKARRRETEKRQQKKRAKNETANFSPNVSTSQCLNVLQRLRAGGTQPQTRRGPAHTPRPRPCAGGPAHAPRSRPHTSAPPTRPRAHAPRPLLLSTARNAASRGQTTSACLFAPHLLVTAAPDSTISSKCRALKKPEESLCVSP